MSLNTSHMGVVDGVETKLHTENGDGSFHITKKQDVQPTLNWTKFLREQPVNRKALDRHVADIPPVIASKLLREGILQDKKRLLKWLDRPENSIFKTWEGHLS